MDGKSLTFGAGKQHVIVPSLGFSQPVFQNGKGGFGKGRAAFLAAFANHSDVSPCPNDDIVSSEPGHFGQSQTRLHGHEHKGVVTPSGPCASIGSSQQGVDLGTCQKGNQGPRETLAGNG